MFKQRRRVIRPLVLLRCAIAAGVLAALQSPERALADDATVTEVEESFAAKDFDHARWSLSNTSVAVTKTDFSRGVMRLIIPPGSEMRPLIGLSSRFGLEGDFDVSVDYSLRSFPQPEKEWINLSIFVAGADGMAAISRTNVHGSGHGYSRWFQPPADSKRPVQANGVKTDDKTGTLRLARVGKETPVLRGSARADAAPDGVRRVRRPAGRYAGVPGLAPGARSAD